ncbi:MAG: (E)-4-hydroxy-3-methylbut-2-enyl-diphosphate synthase [Bacteroidales bacterium]|jgi:(E)-4-hydroxy-3-methylbut-2-enyl-diphosphate synthase|nr:(E)-4-hydroxy-3-methylbut-2-enyl-diphosphate synthase [Bacteroidales bacterium]
MLLYKHPYISSEVLIGNVPMGGNNPVRIQSMTNTDTADTSASVSQCIKIINAGADFVRLTAQGIKEAENLAVIKKELHSAGFDTPLIADIHFNRLAAETAAAIVEKVRINPGNYADKRASFETLKLTEKEYEEELERIHTRLLPLINICRENKTAIRTGINHGSLSDRIMTRYGNTTAGMVASAMEFIRVFRAENFNNLVLSMKSSDTAIMIEATRMLAGEMQKHGMSYPLHIGVTEAGEGEDGRVRSAAGTGTLLSEGIGDTIRVSLSENPENEIPAARIIADCYPRGIAANKHIAEINSQACKPAFLSKVNAPAVMADTVSCKDIKTCADADFVIVSDYNERHTDETSIILPYNQWKSLADKNNVYPLFSRETLNESILEHDGFCFFITDSCYSIQQLKKLDSEKTCIIFKINPYIEKYAFDEFLKDLNENNLSYNIILNPAFAENNIEELGIKAAAMFGRYLNDRLISGLCITNNRASAGETVSLAFSILQCTGTRITRTIYLSCPTCGRTKFNLTEAVRKVKTAISHLKGLKIAVMGCIVNGPGEMAGADYGCVGAAPGKVHIYRGTGIVYKNIPENTAAGKLLELIETDMERR